MSATATVFLGGCEAGENVVGQWGGADLVVQVGRDDAVGDYRVDDASAAALVLTLLLEERTFGLVPVFGLLIASLRSESDSATSGWWTVFTKPAELTLANYQNLISNDTVWHSFLNTVYISVPATVLVVLLAALAAYALAWIEFPGRDWLMVVVVALLVLPIQAALVPIAKLYGALGLFGTITGVVLFHVAFGLPFGIFLLRNFFVGIPATCSKPRGWTGAASG